MTLLPQSLPDAPLPPPGKAAKRSRRVWYGMFVVGFLSVVLLLFGGFREYKRQQHAANAAETLGNFRSLSLSFFEFATEYGEYPDAATIEAVKFHSDSSCSLGTKSSNDFLRQLLASNIAFSENLFATSLLPKKPDNVITDTEALKKGECGYAYFVAPGTTIKSPRRPLVASAVLPGTTRFGDSAYGGTAIVLFTDGSRESLPLDVAGQPLLDGKPITDPAHPVWNGRPPVVAWPDL